MAYVIADVATTSTAITSTNQAARRRRTLTGGWCSPTPRTVRMIEPSAEVSSLRRSAETKKSITLLSPR